MDTGNVQYYLVLIVCFYHISLFCITESPVTFVNTLKDTKTFEQFSVALECEVSKPNRPVKWHKDGKEIKGDARRKLSMDGTLHSLTIRKASMEDDGRYTVTVGDQSTSARLTVQEAAPTFTTDLKNTKVKASEPATFTCELSKPNKKVTWLKNGKELKPDKSQEIKVEGKKHLLIVKNTSSADSGEYTCKIGDENTAAKLIVEGRWNAFT